MGSPVARRQSHLLWGQVIIVQFAWLLLWCSLASQGIASAVHGAQIPQAPRHSAAAQTASSLMAPLHRNGSEQQRPLMPAGAPQLTMHGPWTPSCPVAKSLERLEVFLLGEGGAVLPKESSLETCCLPWRKLYDPWSTQPLHSLVQDGLVPPSAALELMAPAESGDPSGPPPARYLTEEAISQYLSHVAVWYTVRQRQNVALVLAAGHVMDAAACAALAAGLADTPSDVGFASFPSLHPQYQGDEPAPIAELPPAYVVSPRGAAYLSADAFPMRRRLAAFVRSTGLTWGFPVLGLRDQTLPHAAQNLPVAPRRVTPPQLLVLCSPGSTDAEACRQRVVDSGGLIGLSRNYLPIKILQQLSWPAMPPFISTVAATPVPLLPLPLPALLKSMSGGDGFGIDNLSSHLQVHLLCLASLIQQDGGICIGEGTQLLQPLHPWLSRADVALGVGQRGGVSPTWLAVSRGVGVMTAYTALRRMMDLHRGGQLTLVSALQVWQQLSRGRRVHLLPPSMVQAQPIARRGQWHHSSFLEFPQHALSTWLPGLGKQAVSVPQLLHFVWLGAQVPTSTARLVRGWLALHPGWEVRLWTSADLHGLSSAQQIFKSNDLRQRSDIARYEIVWQHGGVYVDADFEAIQPLDPLLDAAPGLVCHENGPSQLDTSLSNGLFGFAKHHPAMARAMAFAGRAQLNTPDVNVKTGPHMFRLAVGDELDKLAVLPAKAFYPIPYSNRELVGRLGCDTAPCGDRFPDSYALHVWRYAGQSAPGSMPLRELQDEVEAHNRQHAQKGR